MILKGIWIAVSVIHMITQIGTKYLRNVETIMDIVEEIVVVEIKINAGITHLPTLDGMGIPNLTTEYTTIIHRMIAVLNVDIQVTLL